jgi:hypothetical protein
MNQIIYSFLKTINSFQIKERKIFPFIHVRMMVVSEGYELDVKTRNWKFYTAFCFSYDLRRNNIHLKFFLIDIHNYR